MRESQAERKALARGFPTSSFLLVVAETSRWKTGLCFILDDLS